MPELKFTDQNFEKEVLKSKDLVLVDFFAEWCGPCKAMAPIIEELAKEYKGKAVKIGKLNVEEAKEIAEKYQIMSVPTLLFFKNGEIVEQLVGGHAKDALKEKIKELLK